MGNGRIEGSDDREKEVGWNLKRNEEELTVS